MKIEIIFFVVVFLVNFLITKNYRMISNILGVFDYPNFKKIHSKPVPLFGGFLLVINFLIYYFFYFFSLDFKLNEKIIFNNINEISYFLVFFIFSFILGIVDDKKNLSPNLRLLIFSILIIFFLKLNQDLLILELKFLSFNKSIFTGSFSLIFTTLCFLIFINACNMFDGINLQSASFYILFILTLIFLLNFLYIYFFLIIFLLFFSFLNRKGKIFLGDSGVYSMAFALAYIIIKNYNSLDVLYVEQIFIIMMYPGFDMIRIVTHRLLKGKHPFIGDKNHIHHLLIRKMNHKFAITLISLMILVSNLLMIMGFNTILIILLSLVVYLLTLYFTKGHSQNL